jgi:integrase
MDKQFLFTHERLSKLPVPEAGRIEYFDTKQQKLRLRVTATGAKSFAVVKKVNDKPKRVTIGKWPEVSIAKARDEAINILDEMRQGIDPTARKRKKVIESTKLVDVLERYLAGRDLKPYTVRDYRYKLRLGFNDWLMMPVGSITEDMVLQRHKKISQIGKTTANTTMRVLRLSLNYAVAVGMIDSNPTSILSKARLWHKNKRKDRVIPSNQLQAWHEAVEALENQKAKVYLLMLLYMGFRSSEAISLEWSHVDLEAKNITLYDTKNRSNHKLPIPVPLLSYIKALRKSTGGSKWVFPNTKELNPMAVPNKPMKMVMRASDVEFSPHDCRRTFATIAEAVNLPLTMIKRLMNHVTTNDVTGGYIVTEEETLRQAINKVADYIQSRVSQKDNVIRLHANH